jgi:hypothetical protein
MYPHSVLGRARWKTLVVALVVAAPVAAQQEQDAAIEPVDDRPRGLVTREELMRDRLRRLGVDNPDPAPTAPSNRADSAEWIRWRRVAEQATGRRIVISVYDRTLWLINGRDTLLAAPAGVGMGRARRAGNNYDFSTPRGRRVVRGKEENPIWVPPDWHYYGQHDRVRQFPAGGIALPDGSRVVRRGQQIGFLRGGAFEVIPPERPLMFEGTLYIPPFGTDHRRIPEVLGAYKLDTGDAILIHGTNDPLAVGFWGTHGCIRLFDDDIEFVYRNTPVGTPVYIY